MDDDSPRDAALLSALTTEHFVLQSANSTTYSEASARSTLYVMALSSSLVALGFLSRNPEAMLAFAVTVLAAIFVLGLFTVVRLVETSLESMHLLASIARIRAYYRTLGPQARIEFAPERGRWPEANAPALRHGVVLAFMGTTASMVAAINNIVGGAALAVALRLFVPRMPGWAGVAVGAVAALVMTVLFYVYQRWRFKEQEVAP